MLFTLIAGHHGSFALGPLRELESIPAVAIDYGYRFFIGKSKWFFDPTINCFLIAPSLNTELRFGYQFPHKISLYGISSLLPGLGMFGFPYHKFGMGVSWGFSKYWSLVGSINDCLNYTCNDRTFIHYISCLVGIQVNSTDFYKEEYVEPTKVGRRK